MSLLNVLEVFRSVGAALTGNDIFIEEDETDSQESGSTGYSHKSPDNASYPVYLYDIS